MPLYLVMVSLSQTELLRQGRQWHGPGKPGQRRRRDVPDHLAGSSHLLRPRWKICSTKSLSRMGEKTEENLFQELLTIL